MLSLFTALGGQGLHHLIYVWWKRSQRGSTQIVSYGLTKTGKRESSPRSHFKSPMTPFGHDLGGLSCFLVPDDVDMTKGHGSAIHFTSYKGYLVPTL